MANINKAAVLNPFTDLTTNVLNYIPRATTSEFGIVAIGSGINVDALGRIYLDTQEYSDRLAAIEAQAASTLDTQKFEVAAAIAQLNKAGVVAIEKGGTGATTLEGARANLGISSVRLHAGTNLNDVTNEGNYYCDADVDSASMPNCPLPYSFTLQVYLTAGIVQRITYYYGASMQSYRRAMYNNYWQQWDRELSENFPSETIELQPLYETSNEALIRKLTKGSKSGFFFNGSQGTAFKQYSAGFYASLYDGAFSAIATDGVSGEVRTLSAVLRDSGSIDFVNSKTLLAKGDYGIGGETAGISAENRAILPPGFYSMNYYTGNNGNYTYEYGSCLKVGNTDWMHIMFFPASTLSAPALQSSINNPNSWTNLHSFAVIGRNVYIDGNGFIKAASPIVKLFADKVEFNDEAQLQNIEFEKLGTGDYLIKGSTGLAQEGWYVEQPKDANGNIYHAVEYGTHDNGDIWVKTYEQMMDGTRIVADHTKPTDIIENRFISIRLNALAEDTTAPINPTVKDDEGNPAPSKYHELVEGVWVINEENAAILEQERLAAMKPLKRRQFRLTLAMNGYDLNEIEALINQIEDPMQRTIAQIEWQDATDFERTNPTLLMMAELMQLSSEQIDQLWRYGLAL